jgi:hypothetical protein
MLTSNKCGSTYDRFQITQWQLSRSRRNAIGFSGFDEDEMTVQKATEKGKARNE